MPEKNAYYHYIPSKPLQLLCWAKQDNDGFWRVHVANPRLPSPIFACGEDAKKWVDFVGKLMEAAQTPVAV